MIVNLEAAGNFISLRCRDRYKLKSVKKPRTTPIIGLNGESLGLGITYKSGPLLIVIGDYFEVINFNIIGLREYNIVLRVL